MAQIRRKSVNPDSRAFLKHAREHGVSLSWDRYENMLPQDGFARLGLACFDCLMGPCRINPFAAKPERTVCGFTADDLVYRTIMRLLGASPKECGRLEDIIDASRGICGNMNPCPEGTISFGSGVLDENLINICVEDASKELLDSLKADGVKVSTVGKPVVGYDSASSLGDAEFLLMSGIVDAYVEGLNGIAFPRGTAAAYHTAVMSREDPAAIISAAKKAKISRKNEKAIHIKAVAEIDFVSMKTALEKCNGRKNIVVIGGSSNIKLTLDELALDIVKYSIEQKIPCVICGGAAVAIAKYNIQDENVFFCAEAAATLVKYKDMLDGIAVNVMSPEISGSRALAGVILLGTEGFNVLTATEIPTGNGELGEKISKLVGYAAPDEFKKVAHSIIEREC